MEGYTILIIDDEEKVRNALFRALRSEGYRILTASSAKDALRAINEGEVYRFITKPWDLEELKVTIRRALEHHKLRKENKDLLQTVKRQADLLSDLERKHPGITEFPRDEEGFYVIKEL